MRIGQIVAALGPIEAKSIRRDPLLRWLLFYPVLIAGLLRWVAPVLREYLLGRFQFDIAPLYPLLLSFVLLMTPMLAGLVVGFLLLDQRDDKTLLALQVSPLGLNGYFVFRITVPAFLSFIVSVIVLPITGLSGFEPFSIVLAALAACLLAPLYALFLGVFAANKVQGFALAKAAGVLLVPPAVAYFVFPPVQWLFGLDPLYWPAKFLWESASNHANAWLYLSVGVLFHWGLLHLLMKRLIRN
jgi:fluoroquinolone transport system permease protein